MMRILLFEKSVSPMVKLLGIATLALGLAACGETDFIPNDDARGADRSFNTLNQLVIADCKSQPEDTQPVAIAGLTFTDSTPENTQPVSSVEGQACI